jgi:hypothetical protein
MNSTYKIGDVIGLKINSPHIIGGLYSGAYRSMFGNGMDFSKTLRDGLYTSSISLEIMGILKVKPCKINWDTLKDKFVPPTWINRRMDYPNYYFYNFKIKK